METHVHSDKVSSIVTGILLGWSFAGNYEFSNLGEIWVLWYPSVQVQILFKSLQFISCKVKLPYVNTEIIACFIYASNCRIMRRELWADLEAISSSHQSPGLPFIALGDFNEIISPLEHSNLDPQLSSRGMRDFSDCLLQSSLTDLHYCGNSFTWSNYRISKKLDRILVNDNWPQFFQQSIGIFGEPRIFDHSPAYVFLDQLKPHQKKTF